MPDLIITRDMPQGQRGPKLCVWDTNAKPELKPHGSFISEEIPYSFPVPSENFPNLPPGHIARLVLADITDHRPLPAVEWVTVGCVHVATLGDFSAVTEPCQTMNEETVWARTVNKNGRANSAGFRNEDEARSWCEAELRKAVAK